MLELSKKGLLQCFTQLARPLDWNLLPAMWHLSLIGGDSADRVRRRAKAMQLCIGPRQISIPPSLRQTTPWYQPQFTAAIHSFAPGCHACLHGFLHRKFPVFGGPKRSETSRALEDTTVATDILPVSVASPERAHEASSSAGKLPKPACFRRRRQRATATLSRWWSKRASRSPAALSQVENSQHPAAALACRRLITVLTELNMFT